MFLLEFSLILIEVVDKIKAFLKQFIKTKTVRFSLQDEIPSKYLVNAIKQVRKDLKSGKASPTFNTAEEAIAFLDRQRV